MPRGFRNSSRLLPPIGTGPLVGGGDPNQPQSFRKYYPDPGYYARQPSAPGGMTPGAFKLYDEYRKRVDEEQKAAMAEKYKAMAEDRAQKTLSFQSEKQPFEVQNLKGQAAERTQKLADEQAKQRDAEMLQRAMWGDTKANISEALPSSTTGYQPGSPAWRFTRNPFAIEQGMAGAKKEGQVEATPPKPAAGQPLKEAHTNSAIQFLNSYKPGDMLLDNNGEPTKTPITKESLMRGISTKFTHADFNNPDIQTSLSRFNAPSVPPSSGFDWSGAANAIMHPIDFLRGRTSTVPAATFPNAPSNIRPSFLANPAATVAPSSIHNDALDWADANPDDPRAAAVRQKALQSLKGP